MTHSENQKVQSAARKMARGGVLGVLLGLMLTATAAMAADDTYENDAGVDVTIPPDIMPAIDATNFVNNNTFSITFATQRAGANAETFESEDTLNYTNNGLMVANSSFYTNAFGVILGISPGCGFLFDHYSTSSHLNSMASSFYNPGNIRANSLIDLEANALLVSTVGKCTINASNIVVPGSIELGEDSLLQLTGQKVDLTRGQLTIESLGQNSIISLLFPGVDIGVYGRNYGTGVDTNNEWVPSLDLTANQALSSFFTSFSYPAGPTVLDSQLFLSNSTPYFLVSSGVSNVVVRAIFLENLNTNNVSAKVYWANAPYLLGGGGFFNIEWDGTYISAATGLLTTNYLYLNDDDVLGSMGPVVINGVPDNFTFFQSSQEEFFGPPATAGFDSGIFIPPLANVTNSYAYVNAQLVPTTIFTNASSGNPSGAISNLTGRVQISAGRELDMTQAQITGGNYMSLNCPTQFDGAAGAQIAVPFADIALGVTNGYLTISNVIEADLPNWGGTIQCFSARWIYVDPTGTTNDYRVLLVRSGVTPTSATQVQNLSLHGTNLVVSDALNAFGTVSIDAQNLTLTTNGPGATSPDGELNINNSATVWNTALPNLLNVTNNGAIRVPNANPVNFGSPTSPYGAFINHGVVSASAITMYVNNFESDGSISNGALGSFTLNSQTATLTNGSLYAGGDVAITTGSLLTSNLFLQASRSLTLTVTNQLTDTGPTNGSIWIVGTNSIGNGISLLRLPPSGDLLGTTITNYAPVNKTVTYTWAATNRGTSTTGYTNDVAVGRLILDALPGPFNPASQNQNGVFTFKGTGASNAMYVDYLELRDAATNRDVGNNFLALNINTNMVIYYADARMNNADVSAIMNHRNSDRLRWIPQYAGQFSSIQIIYPDGSTNSFNAGLAASPTVDSNGNGIPNASDPTPFFVSSQIDLHTLGTTNVPPLSAVIQWHSIPASTNLLYYSTDMINYFVLTNFVSPSLVPPAGGWPITNTFYDPVLGRFYKVTVIPNSTDFYGPGF